MAKCGPHSLGRSLWPKVGDAIHVYIKLSHFSYKPGYVASSVGHVVWYAIGRHRLACVAWARQVALVRGSGSGLHE